MFTDKVENVSDFVKRIEGDDKLVAELKSRNERKIEDNRANMKNNMNKNVNLLREVAGSSLVTKSEGMNKFISKPELKILII